MTVGTATSITPLPVPPLPRGRANLILAGFMGVGKTAVGRELAKLTQMPFIDLDDAIVGRAGRSIPQIFESDGEAGFRALERAVVRDAAQLSGAVIATGGGAPLDRGSFEKLASTGRVVVLAASAAELKRRINAGGDRPLAQGSPGIDERLATRAPVYAALAGPMDTTGRTPSDVAGEIARGGAPGLVARVELDAPDGRTVVLIGPGALADAAADLRSALSGTGDAVRRAVIVSDASVAGTHALTVARLLTDNGIDAIGPIEIPAGEAGKTVDVLARIWDRFAAGEIDPTCAVVAVGGGAALDVAGFAAATYARGLRLVNVPTTTLAMADAAVGGKVAIDHAGAKNLVGAFHPASLVIADTRLCESLDDAVRRQGLAEVAKCAVLASPLALELLDRAPLSWSIEQAVRIKAAYVAADPRDRGVRRALNLGHTFAHAIESASDHAVAHGDAVAIGLVAAARLGARLGTCDTGLADRITRCLTSLGLPVSAPPLDEQRLLGAMQADKKRAHSAVRFVVPAAGGAALASGVDPRDALSLLA